MKPKRLAHFAATSTLLITALASHSATAGTLYWKSTVTPAVWWDEISLPAWSTQPGGPYDAAWVNNSEVVFEANEGTTLRIGGPDLSVNFASIAANENVTVEPFGFLGTGGTVAPVTVAADKTLNFATQDITTDTGFTKNGAGTWVLGNASSYSGGFTLNDGTVAIGSLNALGAGGTLTINGGTTLRSTAATASSGDRNLSGKFTGITIGGDCALGDTTNTGILTFSNPVSLGGGVRTLTVNSGVTLAAGATLANGGIIKNGSGTLTLADAGSYTGGFTLNAGTVTIGTTASTPAVTSALGNGGPLALNGGTLTIAAFIGRSLADKFTNITIGGDPSFTGGAATDALTFNANVNLGSATRTLTVNIAGFTRFTGAGVISGAPGVGIIKAGGGSLILDGSAAHTFSGPLTLTAGGLTIGGTAAQSFPGGISVNGGTLTFTDSAAHTLDGGVTVNSGTLSISTSTSPTFLNKVKMNGGTLTFSFANMVTPTDLIPNGTPLVLEKNISVNITGKSNVASSQTLGDLTINGGRQQLVITAGVSSTMAVTLGSTWTRNDNAALHIAFNSAGASLTCNPGSGPSLNDGIIGPWATLFSLTPAASTYYATVSGGSVVPLIGTVAADSSALTGIGGDINYDLSAVGTAPADTVPAGVSANTIRFTGTAAGNTKLGGSFSVNGLLNATGNLWTIGTGTLTIGSDRELVVNVAGNGGIALAGTVIQNNGGGPSGLTVAGATNNGLAAITLNSANSFTGTTTINGANNVVADGASTLAITNLKAVGQNTEFGAGSSLVLNGATLRVNATAANLNICNRDITINNNCGFLVKNSFALTLTGNLSGSGRLSVDNDPGLPGLFLQHNNDFSGEVAFQTDGKVTLADANALKNATLNLTGQRVSAVLTGGSGNLAYNIGGLKGNAINLNLGTGGGAGGKVTIGSNGQSNVFMGALSGSAGLIKKGAGTQTLVSNTYSGDTVIEAGTLKLGAVASAAFTGRVVSLDSTLGKSQFNVTASELANLAVGQTVKITGQADTTIFAIDSTTSKVFLNTNSLTPNTYAGSFEAMDGNLASASITVQSGAKLEFAPGTTGHTVAGLISGAGELVKSNTGTTTLSAPNTYSGNTTISGGTLVVAQPNFGDSSAVSIASGAVLNLPNAGTDTVGALVINGLSQPVGLYDAGNTNGAITGNGKIQVAGTSSPYDSWATGANLSGPDAVAGADPDKDGVKNLVEFALNGDPTNGSDNGISQATVQNVGVNPALTLTIATRKNASFGAGTGAPLVSGTIDGVVYTIEGSQDLGTWTAAITEIPAIITGLPDLTGTDYEYHTFRTAGPVSSTPKDFIRVKVEGQ